MYRYARNPEWRPVNNKIYTEKRYATLAMRHYGQGSSATWDSNEKVWVTKDGTMLFRIQSSTVDWEDYA